MDSLILLRNLLRYYIYEFIIHFVCLQLFYCYSKEYKAVDELDLTKYDGFWYQVYGDNFNKLFQGNGKCSTAQYKLLDDEVSVLNSQIDENNEKDEITDMHIIKMVTVVVT